MSEKGFTLVETLVSLVVAAMLLGSLSWVIGGLTRDLKAAERADEAEEFVQVAGVLNRSLTRARFTDQSGVPFQRSQEALEFRMPAPEAFRQTGFLKTELVAMAEGGGQVLKMKFPDTKLPPLTLLKNVSAISFSYVQDEAAREPARFITEIRVSILKEHDHEPLALKIYPKINAAGGCVFDPVSQSCRA